MPAQTPPAGSSASSSITAGSFENAEDMRVISDTLSEMSKLIKGEKSYIDEWLITMKRINRLPVSGETRPVERFLHC